MIICPITSHADNFVQNDNNATSSPPSVRDTVRYALKQAQIDDIEHVMAVVECESHFRQFDGSGGVLTSPTEDYGIFQINRHWWLKTSQDMGLDIMKADDNITMGIFILKTSGIKAWSCLKLVATM